MNLVLRQASRSTLQRAQLLVAGLWFVKTVLWSWDDIAELPLVLFEPVGLHRWVPASWWPTLLDASGLEATRYAVLLLLGLALWPAARSWAFLAAALVLTHHQGLLHGFGFVNHQELVLLYGLYVFAIFAFGGRQWEARAPGLPVILILLLLCLTYSMAGAYRLVRHPELFLDPATMMGWVLLNSARPLHYGWSLGLDLPWSVGLAWTMHLGFIGITVLELLAPLALVWRPFRIVFLLIIPIPFHVSCLLLMNIFFWENAVLMVLFFDLAPVRQRGPAVAPVGRDTSYPLASRRDASH